MLGGTSRVFLPETSRPLHERERLLDLLQQPWDRLEFVWVAPHSPVFLCNGIMSAAAAAPGDKPHGSVLTQTVISVP